MHHPLNHPGFVEDSLLCGVGVMDKRARYSPEVRERATRLVWEQEAAHGSQWQAICTIADKIGCTPESLWRWVRQAETNTGHRPGLATTEQQQIKALEREVREDLRGLRGRCLLASDRGLACEYLAAHRPGTRCAGAGAL